MKKVFVLCGILVAVLLASSPCFANGGPIDGSAFSKTGEIVLVKKTILQIEEETLLLAIKGDYVEVSVNYEINNTSNKDEEITFSFPVDIERDYHHELLDDALWASYQKEVVTSYAVVLNGSFVPHQTKSDSVRMTDNGQDILKITRWHTSKLVFDAKEKSNLSVSYRIRATYEDYLYSKSPLPTFKERSFLYSFSAAAGFGNGKAKKFSLTIDSADILKREGEINSVTFMGDSLRTQAKAKKGILKFNTNNFDFAQSPELKVTYENSAAKLTEYFQLYSKKPQSIGNIKTSSALKGPYGAENLFDGDPTTAWCEGVQGNGDGEWIEFEIKDYPLISLDIINGYTKNQESFENNSTITLLAITHNCPNTNDQHIKPEVNTKEYSSFNPHIPLSFANNIVVNNDYMDPVNCTVRLTIKKTQPGKKFSDTCISEIYLLGYPVVDQNKK